MRRKACCFLITSTPNFLWVWHIGWIIWWTLTWPKNATKPYRDYPQWIKPPCLLSLKPPETELYGDQIADSYFSELLCSCYFQRLMSQSYKFTRVNVQTVYSFPALPLLYVWWMLLPKTLRWRKKMKLCWRNLNCCRHFDFYLHIDSRSSSAMTYGTHFRITLMEVWKIVSHLLSQISFHCTTYIHYKFHIMDSCCLRHKFNLAATSIADFISDVTDFILTYRVTPMADFILLTTLVSCHSTSSFTTKNYTTDFISLHFVL